MKIDMEYYNSVLFIRIKGNLNKKNYFRINNYLIDLLKKYHIKYLVCNLNNLNDIDIYGMEALVNLKCMMKINKGKMLLCGLHSRLEKYLKPLKIKVVDSEFLALELIGV